MRRAADAAAHSNVRYARGGGGGEGAGGEAATPSWLAHMPRVAAAASWPCRDGSHGLSRKVTRDLNKRSLGAAACVLGRKAIIENSARYFNLEREAAAAAALDMAAARQLWRVLGLGAAREADGRRRRANDAGTTHAAGAG